MATDEQSLLNQLLGNTPRRASLMQPPAGQSYFSNQTNIPPMVGNFYVGSPTEVISDFVPLPLDFLKEDIDSKQAHFDATRANVNALEGAIREQLKATPYNEEYKEQLLKKYGISDASQQWAKQLLANPLNAGRVAQDLITLKSKILSDTGVQRLLEEHDAWSKEQNAENILSSGWANFLDPTSGQIIQLDPTKIKGQWTHDDHMKYYRENYAPQLKASIKETLEKGGFDTKINEYGMIEYKTPGSSTWEAIDPNNPKNPSYKYVREAIQNIGMELYEDPNLQVRGIMRDRMGFGDDVNRYIDFVYRMVSPQFYNKETVDPGSLHMQNLPKNGGGGGGGNGIVIPDQDVVDVISGGANVFSFGDKNLNETIKTLGNNINALQYDIWQRTLNTLIKNADTPEVEVLEEFIIHGVDGNPGLQKVMNEIGTKVPELQGKSWAEILGYLSSKSEKELINTWGKTNYDKVYTAVNQGLLKAVELGDNTNQIFLDELFEKQSQLRELQEDKNYFEALKEAAMEQAAKEAGYDPKKVDLDTMSNAISIYNDILEGKIKNYRWNYGPSSDLSEGIKTKAERNKEFLEYLKQNEPDIYKTIEEGYFEVRSWEVDSTYGQLRATNKIKETAKRVENTEGWKNIVTGKIATNANLLLTHPDETIAKGTTLWKIERQLENLYKADTNTLIKHLIASAGGDGNDPSNNTSLLEILQRYNPKAIGWNSARVTDVKLVQMDQYHQPRIMVTLGNGTDGKSGETASIHFKIPKEDATYDLLNMAAEFISEADKVDRETGYQIYAGLSMDKRKMTMLNTFFNPNFKPNTPMQVPIEIAGNIYYMYSTGKGDRQIRKMNLATGQLESLQNRGTDAHGKKVVNTDMKTPMEVLKLIGIDLANGGGNVSSSSTNNFSAPGGSTQPGKSPIQKDKLWKPQ